MKRTTKTSTTAAAQAPANAVTAAFAKLDAKRGKRALPAPRSQAQAAPEAAAHLDGIAARAEAAKAKRAAAKPAAKREQSKPQKGKVARPKPQAPKAAPAPSQEKGQLIQGALRILAATTKAGSVKQRRKPVGNGKIKAAIEGRKNPTTRDRVAAIAGVSHSRAMQALAVATDAKLAAQVIKGEVKLAEAFAATR